MLDSGTLIAGRYAIVSPLASGGSGLVYAATDRTTEKRVAIKVLGPHVLHERAAREKLRLEAIVAGRVESEHIVQVSDAGVDARTGFPFLVMELLKGHDLQHWVEQQGPLDEATALEFLRQVALGLDKAHSWKDAENHPAPIVHRDLKPENLFLTHREDGTPLLKILDFGLAKVLSGSATLSNEVRGTPLYMAPEQLLQAPVTPATDIWAIGLIAFFLLTGKCYWKSGQSNNAVLHAVLKEVVDGPTASPRTRLGEFGIDIELPQAFDAWFLRCVNLEPARRFQTAGDAARALAVALGLPQQSSPIASDALRSSPRHGRIDEQTAPPADGKMASAGTIKQARDLTVATDASRNGRSRFALPVILGFILIGGILTMLGKKREHPETATPSPTTSSAGPSITRSLPVQLPIQDAQIETRELPPTASEPMPKHEAARQKKPSVRASVPPAPSTHDPTAANSAAASATATEPTTPPKVHRDPADHR